MTKHAMVLLTQVVCIIVAAYNLILEYYLYIVLFTGIPVPITIGILIAACAFILTFTFLALTGLVWVSLGD